MAYLIYNAEVIMHILFAYRLAKWPARVIELPLRFLCGKARPTLCELHDPARAMSQMCDHTTIVWSTPRVPRR